MKISKIIFVTCIISTAFCCSTAQDNSTGTENNTIEMKDTLINFQNETVNKFPEGFSGLNNCNNPVNWTVVNDSANKVMAQLAVNESSCFNMFMLENIYYKNFDLSVKIKAVAGDEDRGGGLIWRCRDKNNYYIARCNPLENNFRLYKVVNGDRKELKSVDCGIKSGEWFSMSINMNGNKIVCSVNGNKMIEITDDTFPNFGTIGLWTKSDAQTYFDDITVQPIKY